MSQSSFIPFHIPTIGEEEINEVTATLRSGWLTSGPRTAQFEQEFRAYVGSAHALAVNSCTAGLHLALAALRIGRGDEVITTPMTFCATVNAILHVGATPVLADVGSDGNIDPASVAQRITNRTRALIPVHLAGLPCEMEALWSLARRHGLHVIEDAAHAAGSQYRLQPIGGRDSATGACSDAVGFSFYATKTMTTGEGGMVTTHDDLLAETLRVLCLHGINKDAWNRYTDKGNWYYQVLEPGFKYNLSDIQSAIGLHQLRKLERFIEIRTAYARRYNEGLADVAEVELPPQRSSCRHSWHLYMLRLNLHKLEIDRDEFIRLLRQRNIGTGVHFIPIPLHPFFAPYAGRAQNHCLRALELYPRLISLPLYPAMSEEQVDSVVAAIKEIVRTTRKVKVTGHDIGTRQNGGQVKSRSFDPRHFSIGLLHLIMIALSLETAFLLRFDFSIPKALASLFYPGLAIALAVKMAVFQITRHHRRWWWRSVDMVDLYRLFKANAFASLAFTAATAILLGRRFPWSIYCFDFLVCFLLTAAVRFSVRLYTEGVVNWRSKNGGKGILIYGAGEAGTMLVREIRSNPRLRYQVIGFLDDDLHKQRASIMGVPVLGMGSDAVRIVEGHKNTKSSIEEIIIATPSATGKQMREVLGNCRAAAVPCRTMPSLGDLLEEKVLIPQIRNVSVNDLLGREPIQLNEDRIRADIRGRVVLVTGAGGSIGSELCRQVASFEPRKLIALDQAESELFKIDLELRGKFPSLDLVPEIADIRDALRIQKVIHGHAVDSLFHAAAYKHVPIMEMHVAEAVKNNILGTWNLAQAAGPNGVSSFLMISTDKAVNPTSVMGVTKRVAELIVSRMPSNGTDKGTRFVSVRFGNVLGSSGSVVPIFQTQIAAGGPVTVTHPEARRYFMTVREAVQLVLQASTMGKGSEIFVLDMGEPIRIRDLARNMISLAGLIPDEDIAIEYIGLRRGEKIYEELTTKGENILPTYHDKIKIFEGQRMSPDFLEEWIAGLGVLLERCDEAELIAHLKLLVPEYQPNGMRGSVECEPVAAA